MYGILKNENTVIQVNVVGLTLQLLYVVYYHSYCTAKSAINVQMLIGLVFGILGAFHNMYSGFPDDKLIDHTGTICLLLNVLNFAAPLVTLREVINRQNTESLSLSLCLANLLVSGQWLLYGILIDDIYMKIPNFLGFILTLVQLSLFAIYPAKHATKR